jgi:hypothetical protein
MKKLRTILAAVFAALALAACVTDGAYPGGSESGGHSHLNR